MRSGTEYEQLLPILRLERAWSGADPGPSTPQPPTADPGDAWISICALIERQVERCAALIALADGDAEISYRELGRRTAGLAGALRAHGVGRGDLVAVVLGRGIAFVETALALWRLGAAYLPLDPVHPEPWRADVKIGRAHV